MNPKHFKASEKLQQSMDNQLQIHKTNNTQITKKNVSYISSSASSIQMSETIEERKAIL